MNKITAFTCSPYWYTMTWCSPDLLQVTEILYHIMMYRIHLVMIRILTHNVIGDSKVILYLTITCLSYSPLLIYLGMRAPTRHGKATLYLTITCLTYSPLLVPYLLLIKRSIDKQIQRNNETWNHYNTHESIEEPILNKITAFTCSPYWYTMTWCSL
jgi:hypothetical protein